MSPIVVVLFIAAASALVTMPYVYQESFGAHYTHLGISLSNSCITMLQNNIETDCPTYEQILAIHPDHSNKVISGDFEYVDGYLQRTQGMAKNNHFEYYKYHNTFIDSSLKTGNTSILTWVDPPGDIREKIRLITIEPSLPEYKINGISSEISHNGTNLIITGHNRWIADDCQSITISAEDWIFLLGDTIHMANHNCDEEYSSFNHIRELKLQKTEMDISTSYKYKLEKWIEESKNNCVTLCRQY